MNKYDQPTQTRDNVKIQGVLISELFSRHQCKPVVNCPQFSPETVITMTEKTLLANLASIFLIVSACGADNRAVFRKTHQQK